MNELAIDQKRYSREMIQNAKEELISKMENEDIDEMQLAIYLKSMQDIIDSVKKDRRYTDRVLSTISSLGDDDKCHYGAMFSVGSRRKYEYDDSKLNELKLRETMAKDEVKNRKKLLESMKEPVIDSTTGELMKPAALMSSGRFVTIKLI
jgi:hypothetical protein